VSFRRRDGIVRAAVATVVFFLLAGFAAIQLASDAFAASTAAGGTLPARVPLRFGLAVYGVLDRLAPAPYVESTLAEYALDAGMTDAALHHALRLPASPIRDELLARIARARGDRVLALEYFLAAPDVDAVQTVVQSVARRDPAAAYSLERTLNARLTREATHPDAVAETRWQMGELANRRAWREVPASPAQRAWLGRAMRDFESAAALAPLSEKFAIAAANQAMLLKNLPRARALFSRAVAVDPASADAVAGLGVVAFSLGDIPSARAYLDRARRLDPNALMVRALERDVH
jgi:tetratricopeptide (TPR) repeat protein